MPMPLVGRAADQHRLDGLWDRAVTGQGAVALISGEAGIGKSCLAEDLVQRRGSTAHVVRVTGDADRVNDDLAAFMVALREIAPAEVDTVDAPQGPYQRRDTRLAALVTNLLEAARRAPVLLLVEDAQWLDPTSLQALTRLAEAASAIALLVVVTARRSFESPFALLSHTVHITPRRLGAEDARRLVEQRRPDLMNMPDVLDQIVTTADGLPLFLEALVDDLGEGDAATPAASLDAALARLFANLGHDAEIAAAAAAIGQQFETTTLAAVTGLSEAALAPALERLMRRDVLAPAPTVIGTTLAFRHALIRDAAYERLPADSRRRLHTQILTVLDDVPAIPRETLAIHADRAGAVEAMIQHSLAVGMAASGRGSASEAVAVLQRALAAAMQIDDPARRERLVFELNLRLGPALMAAHGYTSAAAFEAFSAARARIDVSRTSLEQLQVLLGVFNGLFGRADLQRAYAVAAEADALLAVGYRGYPLLLGQVLCFMGRFAEAEQRLQRALDVFEPGLDAEKGFFCSSRIVATAVLTEVVFARGDIARAIDLDRCLTDLAANDPHPIAGALAQTSHLFMLFEFERDPTAELDSAITFATRNGLATYRSWFRFYRAAMRVRTDTASGVADMTAILAQAEADGARLYRPTHLALLAAATARAGQRDRAADLFDEALAMAEATTALEAVPSILRLRARFRAATGEGAGAETDLRRGLATATEQDAVLEQLRVALQLVHHLTDPAARAPIMNALADAHARLIGADALPDVRRAADVLARSDPSARGLNR